MKKVFLAIAVASVFTACNNGGESTETKTADTTKTTDTTNAAKMIDTAAKMIDTAAKKLDTAVHKMAADTTKKK